MAARPPPCGHQSGNCARVTNGHACNARHPRRATGEDIETQDKDWEFVRKSGPDLKVYIFGSKKSQARGQQQVLVTVGIPEGERTREMVYGAHGLVLWSATDLTAQLEKLLDENRSDDLAVTLRATLRNDGVSPPGFPERPTITLMDLHTLSLRVSLRKPLWFINYAYPPTWRENYRSSSWGESPPNSHMSTPNTIPVSDGTIDIADSSSECIEISSDSEVEILEGSSPSDDETDMQDASGSQTSQESRQIVKPARFIYTPKPRAAQASESDSESTDSADEEVRTITDRQPHRPLTPKKPKPQKPVGHVGAIPKTPSEKASSDSTATPTGDEKRWGITQIWDRSKALKTATAKLRKMPKPDNLPQLDGLDDPSDMETNRVEGTYKIPKVAQRMIKRAATACALAINKNNPYKPFNPYEQEHREDCARCKYELIIVLQHKAKEEEEMAKEETRSPTAIKWIPEFRKVTTEAIYPCPFHTDSIVGDRAMKWEVRSELMKKGEYKSDLTFLNIIPMDERICGHCNSKLDGEPFDTCKTKYRTRAEGQQIFVNKQRDWREFKQRLKEHMRELLPFNERAIAEWEERQDEMPKYSSSSDDESDTVDHGPTAYAINRSKQRKKGIVKCTCGNHTLLGTETAQREETTEQPSHTTEGQERHEQPSSPAHITPDTTTPREASSAPTPSDRNEGRNSNNPTRCNCNTQQQGAGLESQNPHEQSQKGDITDAPRKPLRRESIEERIQRGILAFTTATPDWNDYPTGELYLKMRKAIIGSNNPSPRQALAFCRLACNFIWDPRVPITSSATFRSPTGNETWVHEQANLEGILLRYLKEGTKGSGRNPITALTTIIPEIAGTNFLNTETYNVIKLACLRKSRDTFAPAWNLHEVPIKVYNAMWQDEKDHLGMNPQTQAALAGIFIHKGKIQGSVHDLRRQVAAELHRPISIYLIGTIERAKRELAELYTQRFNLHWLYRLSILMGNFEDLVTIKETQTKISDAISEITGTAYRMFNMHDIDELPENFSCRKVNGVEKATASMLKRADILFRSLEWGQELAILMDNIRFRETHSKDEGITIATGTQKQKQVALENGKWTPQLAQQIYGGPNAKEDKYPVRELEELTAIPDTFHSNDLAHHIESEKLYEEAQRTADILKQEFKDRAQFDNAWLAQLESQRMHQNLLIAKRTIDNLRKRGQTNESNEIIEETLANEWNSLESTEEKVKTLRELGITIQDHALIRATFKDEALRNPNHDLELTLKRVYVLKDGNPPTEWELWEVLKRALQRQWKHPKFQNRMPWGIIGMNRRHRNDWKPVMGLAKLRETLAQIRHELGNQAPESTSLEGIIEFRQGWQAKQPEHGTLSLVDYVLYTKFGDNFRTANKGQSISAQALRGVYTNAQGLRVVNSWTHFPKLQAAGESWQNKLITRWHLQPDKGQPESLFKLADDLNRLLKIWDYKKDDLAIHPDIRSLWEDQKDKTWIESWIGFPCPHNAMVIDRVTKSQYLEVRATRGVRKVTKPQENARQEDEVFYKALNGDNPIRNTVYLYLAAYLGADYKGFYKAEISKELSLEKGLNPLEALKSLLREAKEKGAWNAPTLEAIRAYVKGLPDTENKLDLAIQNVIMAKHREEGEKPIEQQRVYLKEKEDTLMHTLCWAGMLDKHQYVRIVGRQIAITQNGIQLASLRLNQQPISATTMGIYGHPNNRSRNPDTASATPGQDEAQEQDRKSSGKGSHSGKGIARTALFAATALMVLSPTWAQQPNMAPTYWRVQPMDRANFLAFQEKDPNLFIMPSNFKGPEGFSFNPLSLIELLGTKWLRQNRSCHETISYLMSKGENRFYCHLDIREEASQTQAKIVQIQRDKGQYTEISENYIQAHRTPTESPFNFTHEYPLVQIGKGQEKDMKKETNGGAIAVATITLLGFLVLGGILARRHYQWRHANTVTNSDAPATVTTSLGSSGSPENSSEEVRIHSCSPPRVQYWKRGYLNSNSSADSHPPRKIWVGEYHPDEQNEEFQNWANEATASRTSSQESFKTTYDQTPPPTRKTETVITLHAAVFLAILLMPQAWAMEGLATTVNTLENEAIHSSELLERATKPDTYQTTVFKVYLSPGTMLILTSLVTLASVLISYYSRTAWTLELRETKTQEGDEVPAVDPPTGAENRPRRGERNRGIKRSLIALTLLACFKPTEATHPTYDIRPIQPINNYSHYANDVIKGPGSCFLTDNRGLMWIPEELRFIDEEHQSFTQELFFRLFGQEFFEGTKTCPEAVSHLQREQRNPFYCLFADEQGIKTIHEGNYTEEEEQKYLHQFRVNRDECNKAKGLIAKRETQTNETKHTEQEFKEKEKVAPNPLANQTTTEEKVRPNATSNQTIWITRETNKAHPMSRDNSFTIVAILGIFAALGAFCCMLACGVTCENIAQQARSPRPNPWATGIAILAMCAVVTSTPPQDPALKRTTGFTKPPSPGEGSIIHINKGLKMGPAHLFQLKGTKPFNPTWMVTTRTLKTDTMFSLYLKLRELHEMHSRTCLKIEDKIKDLDLKNGEFFTLNLTGAITTKEAQRRCAIEGGILPEVRDALSYQKLYNYMEETDRPTTYAGMSPPRDALYPKGGPRFLSDGADLQSHKDHLNSLTYCDGTIDYKLGAMAPDEYTIHQDQTPMIYRRKLQLDLCNHDVGTEPRKVDKLFICQKSPKFRGRMKQLARKCNQLKLQFGASLKNARAYMQKVSLDPENWIQQERIRPFNDTHYNANITKLQKWDDLTAQYCTRLSEEANRILNNIKSPDRMFRCSDGDLKRTLPAHDQMSRRTKREAQQTCEKVTSHFEKKYGESPYECHQGILEKKTGGSESPERFKALLQTDNLWNDFLEIETKRKITWDPSQISQLSLILWAREKNLSDNQGTSITLKGEQLLPTIDGDFQRPSQTQCSDLVQAFNTRKPEAIPPMMCMQSAPLWLASRQPQRIPLPPKFLNTIGDPTTTCQATAATINELKPVDTFRAECVGAVLQWQLHNNETTQNGIKEMIDIMLHSFAHDKPEWTAHSILMSDHLNTNPDTKQLNRLAARRLLVCKHIRDELNHQLDNKDTKFRCEIDGQLVQDTDSTITESNIRQQRKIDEIEQHMQSALEQTVKETVKNAQQLKTIMDKEKQRKKRTMTTPTEEQGDSKRIRLESVSRLHQTPQGTVTPSGSLTATPLSRSKREFITGLFAAGGISLALGILLQGFSSIWAAATYEDVQRLTEEVNRHGFLIEDLYANIESTTQAVLMAYYHIDQMNSEMRDMSYVMDYSFTMLNSQVLSNYLENNLVSSSLELLSSLGMANHGMVLESLLTQKELDKLADNFQKAYNVPFTTKLDRLKVEIIQTVEKRDFIAIIRIPTEDLKLDIWQITGIPHPKDPHQTHNRTMVVPMVETEFIAITEDGDRMTTLSSTEVGACLNGNDCQTSSPLRKTDHLESCEELAFKGKEQLNCNWKVFEGSDFFRSVGNTTVFSMRNPDMARIKCPHRKGHEAHPTQARMLANIGWIEIPWKCKIHMDNSGDMIANTQDTVLSGIHLPPLDFGSKILETWPENYDDSIFHWEFTYLSNSTFAAKMARIADDPEERERFRHTNLPEPTTIGSKIFNTIITAASVITGIVFLGLALATGCICYRRGYCTSKEKEGQRYPSESDLETSRPKEKSRKGKRHQTSLDETVPELELSRDVVGINSPPLKKRHRPKNSRNTSPLIHQFPFEDAAETRQRNYRSLDRITRQLDEINRGEHLYGTLPSRSSRKETHHSRSRSQDDKSKRRKEHRRKSTVEASAVVEALRHA